MDTYSESAGVNDSTLPRGSSERAVERVREGLLLPLPIGSVAAGLDSDSAQTVHEVPHRQPLTNALGRVLITARIENDDALWHQLRRERNIRRHGDVARDSVI